MPRYKRRHSKKPQKQSKRAYLKTVIGQARQDSQPVVIIWDDDHLLHIPATFHIVRAIQAPIDHVEQLTVRLPNRIPILTTYLDNGQLRITNLRNSVIKHFDRDTAKDKLFELYQQPIIAEPAPLSRTDRKLRRQQIATEISTGLTIPEAIAKYNLSEYTIRSACREHNIQPPTTPTIKPRRRTRRRPKSKLSLRTFLPILADLTHTDTPLVKISQKHRLPLPLIHRIYRQCLQHHIPIQLRLHESLTWTNHK